MFDELVETNISGDGKVTVKSYVADEQSATEIDAKAEKQDIVKAIQEEEQR